MTEVSHEVDGIDLRVNIVCDPGAAVSFVGCTAKVYAGRVDTGEVFTGTATATGDLQLRVRFLGGALPPATYAIQVVATPVGHEPQTVFVGQWQILRSLGPA